MQLKREEPMAKFTGYCMKCRGKKEFEGAEVIKDTKKGQVKFVTGPCPDCRGAIWKIVGRIIKK